MAAVRCHRAPLPAAATAARPPAAHVAAAFRPSSQSVFKRQRLSQQQRKAERGQAMVVRAAMFDTLSHSLEKAWESVRKDSKLTKGNIKEPLREIRRALLEADVSLPVVRTFVKRVEEEALGERVVKGLTPDKKLVKVVYDQLVVLMGSKQEALTEPPPGEPQVILMAGLQGTGKTTAAGKLALLLKKQGLKVLLVATDVYRPAAIDQLVALGQRIEVPVFELGTGVKPAEIARRGLDKARAEDYDTVIVDTAGRLQIDADMMEELKQVKAAVRPTDTLLVVDAMTGQEAAALVKSFNEAADITGALLTKMDGDSRGGAALSVKEVSGKPIKFVGTGEKMEALEPFYPDRMASRILGMGDVLTLVEKVEQSVDAEDAERLAARMMTAKFDFNDFLKQYRMVSGMGNLSTMVKLLPGMNKVSEKQLVELEKQYTKYEAMINSMTKQARALGCRGGARRGVGVRAREGGGQLTRTCLEREKPELLAKSPSRRRRAANGSGRTEKEVAELVAIFSGMRAQMQTLSRMMALGGGMAMPSMSDEEMMEAVMSSAGPRPVAPGCVRRKRRSLTAAAAARAAATAQQQGGGGGDGAPPPPSAAAQGSGSKELAGSASP
eukprot:scaffold14.g1287.t1